MSKDPTAPKRILLNLSIQGAIVVLVLVLATAGLVLSQLEAGRDKFLSQPLVQRACEFVDCSFLASPQYLIDYDKLSLSDTVAYPSASGYTLRFVVHNQAPHPQPLPPLLFSSFTNDGSLLAQHTIEPDKYYNSGDASSSATGIVAAQSAEEHSLNLEGVTAAVVRYTLRIAEQ